MKSVARVEDHQHHWVSAGKPSYPPAGAAAARLLSLVGGFQANLASLSPSLKLHPGSFLLAWGFATDAGKYSDLSRTMPDEFEKSACIDKSSFRLAEAATRHKDTPERERNIRPQEDFGSTTRGGAVK